ncbi:MAG TPA: methylated-DNA--[protein]-cysteine S-methyltransferase [Candidatus Eremiobacteraceae bacterium]
MKQPSASAIFHTPVGPLFVRADAGALTELSFVDRAMSASGAEHEESRAVVNAVERQMSEFFAGLRTAFDVPIKLIGSPFHVRVWEALRAIPYGATVSYGQLAKQLGDPDGARAVGSANGANPIVIIVPCHRVIGANGSLVGYGGGLHRKRVLLDLESGRTALDLAFTPFAASSEILHTRQAAP